MKKETRLRTFDRVKPPSAAFLGVLFVAFVAACASPPSSKQIDSEAPSVTYEYETDAGLLEANAKARAYCGQYASTPSVRAEIGDENTVTFVCVKTAAVAVDPNLRVYRSTVAAPAGYYYRTDTELLAAIQSADAYCERYGDDVSTRVITHPDGSKTLTFRCEPS